MVVLIEEISSVSLLHHIKQSHVRTNSAEADSIVNSRFKGDLHQALEEGLSLSPVVQFKAKQRFII